jgi:uncharacterized protein YraI
MKKNAMRLLMAVILIAMLFSILTAAPKTVQADTGSNWTGYYWNNNNFSGNPTVTRTDPAINFNWASGSPDPAIPNNNFTARWYNTITFPAGTYTFRAGAEDGIRVALGGNLILNQWGNTGKFNVWTSTVTLGAGNYQIIVDFVHYTGNAGVLFDWSGTSSTGTGPTAVPTGVGNNAIPTTPVPSKILAVIIASIANVRSGPSTDNPILTQVFKDEQYSVVASNVDGTWYEINLPDGRSGWIFRRWIYLYHGDLGTLPITNSPVTPVPSVANVQGVTNGPVIVRDGPSKLNTQKIGALNEGQYFKILALSRTHAWVLIDADGLKGWVFLPLITVVSGDLGSLPVSSLPH